MNISHTRNRLAVAVALASTAAFAPMPTSAQEGAVLEEITVTARRRSESLQEVPIAVTAFTGDDLKLRGAADITELAQQAPSVTLEPTRATNTTLTAFIRGIGQQDPLAGFEQGVALYIDDVYLARPQGSLLDIYDVERIEVLRGPQGTLYGRNAVGGAIKYVTRRLSDEPEFSVRASYGEQDQMDLVGTASVPLSDTFRVGGTVASFQRDGFGENLTTGEDQYEKDIFAFRLSAEWEPSEDLLVRFAYDNTQDDTNPVAGHRPYPAVTTNEPVLGDVYDTFAGAEDQPSTAGIGGNNEVEVQGGSLSIDWDVNDRITLRSITAYREDDTDSVIDFDSLPQMDFDAQVIYENEQFSQEFQLLYSDERWNAVVGVYYLDAEAGNDFDVVLGQLVPDVGLTAYTGGQIDTEAWSVFGDVTYDFNEQWSLSVGLRWTDDQRDADVFRASYLGIGSPAFGNDDAILNAVTSDYENDETFDNLAPRINVTYRISEDAQVYAGYSQGWKAGSFDPRGANFDTPEAAEGFDEETLDSFEVGLKADWLDGRLRTNVALFYSEYDDMQIPGSVGVDTDGDGVNDDFVGTVTNAGEAEISGLEVEGNWLITNRLSAQFAYSYLDAEIKEWIFDGQDVSDQREIQNTPENMAFLGLTYVADFYGGTLNMTANWSFKDDIQQFEIAAPDIDQDSYNMYNASVVWLSPEGHWSLGLHGKNLGDEEIRTAGYCFGFQDCPSSLGLENNTTVFFAPPRTWTATVEYTF